MFLHAAWSKHGLLLTTAPFSCNISNCPTFIFLLQDALVPYEVGIIGYIYTRWVHARHMNGCRKAQWLVLCVLFISSKAQKSAKKEIHHLRLLCLHCATVFASITVGWSL